MKTMGGLAQSFKSNPQELGESDSQQIYRLLEQEFIESFISEVLPGIVHNFANPLSGIIGRSKLLQRKLSDMLQKTMSDDGSLFKNNGRKLINDVESIARESDRLSNMIQIVAGKIMVMADKKPRKINLNELINFEMQFCDFYLDFKHNVIKTINLEDSLPYIMGIPAYYSMAFSSIIRNSVYSKGKAHSKELGIASNRFDNSVRLIINSTVIPDSATSSFPDESSFDEKVIEALRLLVKHGARIEIKKESYMNKIVILFPCQRE